MKKAVTARDDFGRIGTDATVEPTRRSVGSRQVADCPQCIQDVGDLGSIWLERRRVILPLLRDLSTSAVTLIWDLPNAVAALTVEDSSSAAGSTVAMVGCLLVHTGAPSTCPGSPCGSSGCSTGEIFSKAPLLHSPCRSVRKSSRQSRR
jgi:hypothetical protein